MERILGGNPPTDEDLKDEETGVKPGPERTRAEMMSGELKSFIEMHEFPNRMRPFKTAKAIDIDGKPIPSDITLLYNPMEGVRMRGETIYGQYGEERGDRRYWVKIGDADYRASRAHGYTRASP